MAFLDESGLAEVWKIVNEKIAEDIEAYRWLRTPVTAPLNFSERSQVNLTRHNYRNEGKAGGTVYYSDRFGIDKNGSLYLVNPSAQPYTYNNALTTLAVIKDVYFMLDKTSGNFVWHASASSAPVTYRSGEVDCTDITDVATITVKNQIYGDAEYILSGNIEAYPTDDIVVETTLVGEELVGYRQEFVGSISKNSIAYYRLNTEAVLDALLGMES